MWSRMLTSFAAALAVALAVVRPAPAATDPVALVNDLGKRAIQVLTSAGSEGNREAQFNKLFAEGFDVEGISRFVLGPYWQGATPQQREEFKKLFQTYEVHAYTVRFNQYSGQQLKVLDSRPEGDGALVRSQIVGGSKGEQPVSVDWRVRKVGGDYKVGDVVVEGVSMAVSVRQEFASVIQRNGGKLEALLQLLRQRTGQG